MLDRQTGPPCVDAPRSRSDWMVGFPGSRPSCSIQRLSVEKPTQISAATCLRSKLLVSAIRTAAVRKTGVGFCTKMFLLCSTIPSQRSGTMPQKVHPWPFYHLIILNDFSPLSFHLTSITKNPTVDKNWHWAKANSLTCTSISAHAFLISRNCSKTDF